MSEPHPSKLEAFGAPLQFSFSDRLRILFGQPVHVEVRIKATAPIPALTRVGLLYTVGSSGIDLSQVPSPQQSIHS